MKPLHEHLLEKAIDLYSSGKTQSEVARELGTTQKVIWGLLKRNGYKCRVAAKRNQWGENNHMWKGDGAGYASLHRRVELRRGKPRLCEHCSSTKAIEYNWANISGNYHDVNDYIRLCRSCHAKMDNHARFLPHKTKICI